MPLHQTLRDVDDNGNSTVFSSRFLTRLLSAPTIPNRSDQKPASVLLRTAALYALTQRNPEGLNESIRVMPRNDCLFPFIDNGTTFSERVPDRVDLIIARAEMGNNNTINAFQNYCEDLNNIPNIIPPGNNNIFDDYHSYLNLPDSNFFDEVNATCNSYKEIASFHSRAIRQYEDGINVSGSNYTELLVSMIIQAGGNYGSTKVESWNDYTGDAPERRAFLRVKECLANNTHPLDMTGRIIRNLYRLECVREPAALLTNAMFLQLASMNNNEGYRTIYKVQNGYFGNINLSGIKTYMPMAKKGAVNACRCLWRDIMLSQSPDDMNEGNLLLYYRYDYDSYNDAQEKNSFKSSDLYRLENNLLFNYILSFVWDDKKDFEPESSFLNNDLPDFLNKERTSQIEYLERTLGYSSKVDYPNIYEILIYLGEHREKSLLISITFPMDFTKSVSIGDISIHYFPLAILNKLLLDAYNVDIRLPDQQIEINLRVI